jgi:hypothetical protein
MRQNSITARFMGKLLLETSSLWRRFSVSHDVLSNSLPRGDRGSLAYLDLRFVCGPIYLSRAVAELRAQGEFMPDTLLSHIGPLGWEHISFNGDYFWPSEPFKDGSVRCEIPAPRSSMLLSVLKQILAMTRAVPPRALGDSSSLSGLPSLSLVRFHAFYSRQPVDFRRNPTFGNL